MHVAARTEPQEHRQPSVGVLMHARGVLVVDGVYYECAVLRLELASIFCSGNHFPRNTMVPPLPFFGGPPLLYISFGGPVFILYYFCVLCFHMFCFV